MSKPLKRVVYFHTSNANKVEEARRHFGKYDIEVVQTNPLTTLQESLEKQNKAERYLVLCAFYEQTELCYDDDTPRRIEGNSLIGTPVIHVSHLTYKFQNGESGGKVTCRRGIWRPDKSCHISEVMEMKFMKHTWFKDGGQVRYNTIFGFDDKVMYLDTGMTMADQVATGVHSKETPRDRNICEVIAQIVHYKKPVAYKHIPIVLRDAKYRCVNFEVEYFDVVRTLPAFMCDEMQSTGFANVFIAAANAGTYMRAPWTRVQKLPWVVGLTGMPFVPKAECAGQEYTYFAHDSTHAIHPDPMMCGPMTPLEKKMYTCLRLMSEVFTLGTGDMVIVHILMNNGMSYDSVDRRKLYPAFREILETSPDFFTENRYKELVLGFFEHTFYGNDKHLLNLGVKPETLNTLFAKYDAYLQSDAVWSARNCHMASANPDLYEKWWASVKDWPTFGHGLSMPSIKDIVAKQSLSDETSHETIARAAFNYMYFTSFAPLFRGNMDLLSHKVRKKNALVRYMMNQAFVFFKHPIEVAHAYLGTIRAALTQPYSVSLVVYLRGIIDRYVNVLYDRHLISGDEAMNYKELVPHFPENYIDYDHCDVSKPVCEFVEDLLNEFN